MNKDKDRIANGEEFSEYSDLHKSVYGFRPRHEVTVGEIEDFHNLCYEDEPVPVEFEDGSVHMIYEPRPWLKEQWAEERARLDEYLAGEKWDEAVFYDDFSLVQDEIEPYLAKEQEGLVKLELAEVA